MSYSISANKILAFIFLFFIACSNNDEILELRQTIEELKIELLELQNDQLQRERDSAEVESQMDELIQKIASLETESENEISSLK